MRKTQAKVIMTLALVVFVSSFFLQPAALAQGPLAPPGAPGETMKTLDQVEPRTPISAEGHEIQAPGSYYLTTNIITSGATAGLRIQTNNVTLDLNGFSILGHNGSGNGISVSAGVDNALIRNGTIRDCYYHGIDAASATRCVFQDLRVLGNARFPATHDGINAGSQALVERCQITDNGGDGLVAGAGCRIVNNTIIGNGNNGIELTGSGSYVADNIVKSNADNYDIAAGNQLNILLCEVPESIDWPASVKFAGTLICSSTNNNGITVNADDVTIDMSGHALIGPGASSQSGIYQLSSWRNLRVFNGKVVEWSGTDQYGVYATGRNTQLQHIQAATNNYGIYSGADSTISDCSAYNNQDNGIYADSGSVVSRCSASYNKGYGISGWSGSTISGCSTRQNKGDGIYGGSGSTISGCSASYNTNDGIYGSSGSTISGCTASGNTGDGIEVFSDSQVTGNTCDNNGEGGDGAGIHVTNDDNRIDSNNVTENDRGIDVDGNGSLIVRNSASGNTTNYVIAANNKVGVIVSAPNSAAISGDTGGAGVGSTDPWANITF
ncbi:MAG: right-handed parallel beta-helix repeat-containing protein [Verrucomicrobia bacterium]|nr:right-handed parallel beta-helix repeat-containing protein [Verrucomicrobiota bacterium]